jgi:Chaperone of endosialidase
MFMKLHYSNYLLGLLFLAPIYVSAQVGVNTTNPQAQLDITASNTSTPSNKDGLLIPRIDTFPATNPTATQQSMLVYLTTTTGSNSPGFYYWDNTTTSWKSIAVASTSSGWNLAGNSGTTNGANFIGTTDNQSLDIRTNNVIKARITTKGQIEVLNTGQSVFVGENAGANDDLSNRQNVFIGFEAGKSNTNGTGNTFLGKSSGNLNTTGNGNAFFGRDAGRFNTTGTWNNAFGDSALNNNTSGNNNIGLGRAALSSNTTASSNIGIGRNALSLNATGNENTIIGDLSMWLNSGSNNVTLGSSSGRNSNNASNNTFIGFNSGYNNNGNSNVFLGYQSGSNETGSDKLYIDNSNTSNPLIYGDFLTNVLKINGTLNINNAYNLPTTTGTANQVLQTNGAGATSWVNASTLSITETDPQVSSSTTNFISKWNGTTLVDGQVFDNGTNVGIGTTAPGEKLDVVGNIKGDQVYVASFLRTGGILPNTVTPIATFHTGGTKPVLIGDSGVNKGVMIGRSGNDIQGRAVANFTANSDLLLNPSGGNVGIGTSAPAERLDVNGKTKTTNLQVTTGATAGYVLQSDATGNGTWVNASSLSITETDPQVSSTTTNYIPKWNGTTLVDGQVYDNGTNVGLGTISPSTRFHIASNNTVTNTTIESGNQQYPTALSILPSTHATSRRSLIKLDDWQILQDITGTGSKDFTIYQGSTLSQRLTIGTTGNVGVGINTPTEKLEVNGKTKTNNIQVTTGATSGYVLQSDATGNGTWVNPTSLTITESDPQVSSSTANYLPKWNGTTLVDGQVFDNGTNVGVGTTTPTEKLEVNGKTKTNNIQVTTGATSGYVLQSDATGNGTWVNPSILSVTEIDPQVSSSTVNYLPKWNGTTLVDGQVFDNGTNIGIGITTPTEKLDVNGKIKATNLQVTTGATTGYVFQSDATGNGTWVNPTSLTITESDPQVSSSTANYLPKWNGTTLVDGLVFDDGTNVGVGTTTPTEKLEVNGKTKTNNIQVTTGATSGYVLQSDATGNGTWVNPTSLTITESDPQVSSSTANYLPKWNGTTLVDGQVFDDGTNVGVGTITPTDKVHVVGNIKIDGGKIPFVNTGQSVFIGENAGLNDDLSLNYNTFVGNSSGRNNTSGYANAYLGFRAGLSNISGTGNIALGYEAFRNSTIGNQNLALGFYSLRNNISGNGNVSIGTYAGENNTGSRNVFIGYDVASNETGSDKLYIDNSSTATPLIYGDFASNLLKVNGTLNVNNAYNLPTVGGSANQILQTDGAGATSWVNPSTLSITETDPQVSSSVTNYVPRWIGTTLDDGSIQDDGNSIGVATAPVAGNRLTVNGKTSSTNLQITSGATSGFILQSDASGNASWVNPTSLTVAETDPQVSSATTNYMPKWNGTTLVDGEVFDNGTNVGIGTATPTDKLHVVGNVKIDGGKLPFINTGNSVFIGQNSGLADDLTNNQNVFVGSETGKVNTTGNLNTFVGYSSGTVNTTGAANTSIGANTLDANTTGINNVAIGTETLTRSTTASNNLAVGTGSGQFITTGQNNTFVGSFAGNNATGNNNVFLGFEAGNSSGNGTGNIFLGNRAGYSETTSNKLYIDNSNTTTPLIWGDFSTDVLKVNGTLNINNAYNLPTVAGTVNQILQTNGAGVTTWVNPSTLSVTETDPQVSATTTNYMPKWNGTTLVDGQVFDDGANVGIGTTTPTQAKLVVNGSDSNTLANYGFLNRTTPTGTLNPGTAQNYSIYASNRIAASEFNAFSDERIKNIKGISNSKEDLKTLINIEITDYKLKDSIAKGNKDYKKVIAQQVEKVFPQAVSIMTDVVPDIYKQAEINNGYVSLENNLKVGEKIKIIFSSGEEIVEIKVANKQGFLINAVRTGKIFVYGHQVDDFHTVDYEALAMLNVSATQELLKRIESLEKENTTLKAQVSSINELKTEINEIKITLSKAPLLLTHN